MSLELKTMAEAVPEVIALNKDINNEYDDVIYYDVEAGVWNANKWINELRNGGAIKIWQTQKDVDVPVWELFEVGIKLSDDDTICFGIRPKLGIFFICSISSLTVNDNASLTVNDNVSLTVNDNVSITFITYRGNKKTENKNIFVN